MAGTYGIEQSTNHISKMPIEDSTLVERSVFTVSKCFTLLHQEFINLNFRRSAIRNETGVRGTILELM